MQNEIKRLEDDIVAKQLELRDSIDKWQKATGNSFTKWAPHLDVSQVANCLVLPSRYHIIDLMPKNAVCTEVGTQGGHFAREIFLKTSPSKFHIIDLDLSQFEQTEFFDQPVKTGQVVMHEGNSSEVLSSFPDAYFDWIYIDGDHSYDGFSRDLLLARNKLKPAGMIVCNDYTPWSPAEVFAYGIMRGIHELCVSDNWEFVYLGLHGQGYHDVCIRKRAGEMPPR